jgi:hypothetical protein
MMVSIAPADRKKSSAISVDRSSKNVACEIISVPASIAPVTRLRVLDKSMLDELLKTAMVLEVKSICPFTPKFQPPKISRSMISPAKMP